MNKDNHMENENADVPLFVSKTLRLDSTDEQSGTQSKVFTQRYQLQKATKNGARIKAIDAEQNSLHYINLRDHDVPYVYVSKRLLDSMRNGGNIPVEFTITIEAVEWADN
jgi:hypothetical protein